MCIRQLSVVEKWLSSCACSCQQCMLLVQHNLNSGVLAGVSNLSEMYTLYGVFDLIVKRLSFIFYDYGNEILQMELSDNLEIDFIVLKSALSFFIACDLAGVGLFIYVSILHQNQCCLHFQIFLYVTFYNSGLSYLLPS